MNQTYALVAICTLSLCVGCQKDTNVDWAYYLGDPGATHYAQLNQINRDNVHQLQVAWTYSSGDADTSNRSQIQCNPLIIDGILYGTSPLFKCFSLDAATGRELWTFDPFIGNYELFGMGVNRGLAYWTDGKNDQRIIYCAGAFLYALNAKTGQLVKTFGDNGKIDLHDGLGRDVSNFFVAATSPGVVYKDLFIVGTRVSEATGAAPGHIRAYDVRTGKQQWIFGRVK